MADKSIAAVEGLPQSLQGVFPEAQQDGAARSLRRGFSDIPSSDPPDADEEASKKNQVPIETLAGDPLHDLPDAQENGACVAILPDLGPGEIGAFMNRYGIESKPKRAAWMDGMPEWLERVLDIWDEAFNMDIGMADEDEENGEAKEYEGESGWRNLVGFLRRTTRARKRAETTGTDSAGLKLQGDGEAPEGSAQVAWAVFRMACGYINKTALFANFFGFLIVFNTIFMGFQADNPQWREEPWKDWVDNMFVLLFFFEMVVRLTASGKFSTDNMFLYFDSVIVLLGVFQLWIMPLVLKVSSNEDMRFIQVFRVLRILRLTRLVKLIKFLRPLRLMESTLRSGVANFVSVLGFLIAYLYAASLIFKSTMKSEDVAKVFRDKDTNYSETMVSSMIYLFEAMFCGFDWMDSWATPFLHDSNTKATGILLIIFMFCSKLALGNLITSSMVECHLKTSILDASELEQEDLYRSLDVQALELYLDQADDNLDGRLSWIEFVKFVRRHENGPKLLTLLGIRSHIDANGVADARLATDQLLQMRKVYQALDVASEDNIPHEVIVLGYVKLRGSKKEVQGLIFDYLLKMVLVMARQQHTWFVSPMEHHLVRIEKGLFESVRHLKFIQIDLEDVVKPVNDKLSKLEASFAQLGDSFKFPTSDAETVPMACGIIASQNLQAEMQALRIAAENFIRSQGFSAERAANARGLPNSAWSNDAGYSPERQHYEGRKAKRF
jgi:hypothetical protein